MPPVSAQANLRPETDPAWEPLAACIDAMCTHDAGRRAALRELHEPHARAALRLAGGRGLFRPPLRALIAGPRPVCLPSLLRRRCAARVYAAGRAAAEELRGAPSRTVLRLDRTDPLTQEHGPFDLAATESLLIHASDPREWLAGLWRLLRPGGFLLCLGEPRRGTAFDKYLARMRKRLADQLSKNDEIILHPEADPILEAIAAESEDLAGAGFDPVGAWLAAHPSCPGVDAEQLMQSIEPGIEPVLFRRYGSFWRHPLTPFPYVDDPEAPPEDVWTTTMWRKPR